MSEHDPLGEYLADGWEICGYSVCLMAMGATSHHILLKKGASVATCTVLSNGGQELGRGVVSLSPPAPPAPKKGFWG